MSEKDENKKMSSGRLIAGDRTSSADYADNKLKTQRPNAAGRSISWYKRMESNDEHVYSIVTTTCSSSRSSSPIGIKDHCYQHHRSVSPLSRSQRGSSAEEDRSVVIASQFGSQPSSKGCVYYRTVSCDVGSIES